MSKSNTVTTDVYELECTDCGFEETVEGGPLEAIEVANAHEKSNGQGSTDHFVNLKLAEE